MLFEVFLLNEVSFESDASKKDPCITREQSIGIHDLVNDEGFVMHYRVISDTVFSNVRESIQQSKRTN